MTDIVKYRKFLNQDIASITTRTNTVDASISYTLEYQQHRGCILTIYNKDNAFNEDLITILDIYFDDTTGKLWVLYNQPESKSSILSTRVICVTLVPYNSIIASKPIQQYELSSGTITNINGRLILVGAYPPTLYATLLNTDDTDYSDFPIIDDFHEIESHPSFPIDDLVNVYDLCGDRLVYHSVNNILVSTDIDNKGIAIHRIVYDEEKENSLYTYRYVVDDQLEKYFKDTHIVSYNLTPFGEERYIITALDHRNNISHLCVEVSDNFVKYNHVVVPWTNVKNKIQIYTNDKDQIISYIYK